MGLESTDGVMEANLQGIGQTIKSQALEFTFGQMDESTEENGKRIIWKDSGTTLGKMAELSKASMQRIKSMGMEYTFGMMDENTWGTGSMENSTAQENMKYLRMDL